jgi:hypothetical protein
MKQEMQRVRRHRRHDDPRSQRQPGRPDDALTRHTAQLPGNPYSDPAPVERVTRNRIQYGQRTRVPQLTPSMVYESGL